MSGLKCQADVRGRIAEVAVDPAEGVPLFRRSPR